MLAVLRLERLIEMGFHQWCNGIMLGWSTTAVYIPCLCTYSQGGFSGMAEEEKCTLYCMYRHKFIAVCFSGLFVCLFVCFDVP